MPEKKTQIKKADVISALNSDPSEENWKSAIPKMLKEGKYYYVFYPDGVNEERSLLEAHAVIYGSDKKILYKVPIVKKSGKKIEGATIALKGLQINRSVIR